MIYNRILTTTLKVIGWIVGIGLFLIIGVIIFFCLWLTPGRLADIAEKEADKYLDADVRIGKIDYKVFSTFPFLEIEIDSLQVISRSLDNIPDSIKHRLPPDYPMLFSAENIGGAINIRDLVHNKVLLKNLHLGDPVANVVMVDDSTANFLIFPTLPKTTNIPEMELDSITIAGPIDISFFDLGSATDLHLDVDGLKLGNVTGKKNAYDLSVAMKLSGESSGISIPKPLPIEIGGNVSYNVSPFNLGVESFILNIPDLNVSADIDLSEKDENYLLERFDCKISSSNLLSLREWLPDTVKKELPQFISEISGNLPFAVSLNLDSPFNISALTEKDSGKNFPIDSIPSFNVRIEVNDADVRGRIPRFGLFYGENIKVAVDGVYKKGRPQESSLHIEELSLFTEGMNVSLTADLIPKEDMMTMLETTANVSGTPDPRVEGILQHNGITLNGKVMADIALSCLLDSWGYVGDNNGTPTFNYKSAKDIDFNGDFRINRISFSSADPKNPSSLSNLELSLKTDIPSLSQSNFDVENLDLRITFDKGNVNIPNSLQATLQDVDFSLGTSLSGSISSPKGKLGMDFKANGMALEETGTAFNAEGLDLNLSANIFDTPVSITSNYSINPAEGDDAILQQRVAHSPIYLVVQNPTIQNLLSMASMNLDLKVNGGGFKSSDYLATCTFSDIDISTDFDRLSLNNLGVRIDDTGLKLNGTVDGLRAFFGSGSPSLLDIKLNADFDNVDINRLSGAYYAAVERKNGKPYDFTLPPAGPFTAADSLCILIPRNLKADINLYSKRAEYMNFSFSPLSTKIILDNGAATLSRLTIGAPYGQVSVDWTYSTSSFDNIFMALNANIDHFDFTQFFRSFPELTEKMPQLANLAGEITANANGKFLMFPSMFLNLPSMNAKFNVEGKDFSFAREGMVEFITHLMMIKGDEPIRLTDFHIDGNFHDCLLRLNPFKLKFDGYQLGFAGVNNLQGEMYYHVALEKSPFHIPFAVNLVGHFKHPEVRFGGTTVKDGREREISANLDAVTNINIMQQLSRGWKMFIMKAAEYDLKRE